MHCSQKRSQNHCGGGRGGRGSRGARGGCGGRGGRGGFRFHHPYMMRGHPHFHPFMMGGHPFFVAAENKEEETDQALQFQKNKTTWNESDESYTFQMDVPGVKAHHVTIEEKDGEIEVTAFRMSSESEISKTYQEILYVRPSTADFSNALATLDNGVLTFIVPKKSNEPVDIETETADPPASAAEGTEFRTSMDLPGVKSSGLQIQAREGKVYVEAERKVGDRVVTIRRIVEVQHSTADMARARGFLQDGVLTLVAPLAQEEEANSVKPAGMRTIRVTASDTEVPSAFASLCLDEAGKGEEAAMIVETVTENDKEESWEEVSDTKKAD